jgi:uncharacterized protein YybS (DUF2232 family)
VTIDLPQNLKGIIKDGLIYTGLFLLLLASLSIPFIHLITFWLLPLPFFLLRVKQPPVALLIPLLVTGGILLFFPAQVFVLILVFAWPVGSVMGQLYRWPDRTGTDVVLGGVVAGLVAAWLVLYLGQTLFHLLDSFRNIWQEEWLRSQEALYKSGMVDENLPMPSVGALVPVFLFLVLIPVSLITFVVACKWLVHKGFPGKYLPPFHEWRLPKIFFYFYFFALLLSFFLNAQGVWSMGILGVLHLLFLLQGLAFAGFLLHRYKRSKGWYVLLFLLALPFSMLFLFMGLIDTGTHLRARLNSGR